MLIQESKYLIVSTGWNLTSINWKLISKIVSSAHQPIRCLGFQTYITKYLGETLKHVLRDFAAAQFKI